MGTFCVFTIACVLKMSEIRRLLAVLYVIFLITFVTSTLSFFSISNPAAAAAILWNTTTPESLLSLETYSEAVRLAINSGGVVSFGVMSAASFRNRNGNSYRHKVCVSGDCDYIIDLWELYPEDNAPRYLFVKPTGSTNMGLYYELPALTILMAIVGTTDIGAARQKKGPSPISYYVAIGLIAFVLIAFLLRGFFHAWRRNEWSSLFCVTPEHPSFIRIHSQAIEHEQIIVPQALLNAIYSAELKEEALKTAPLPADSIKDVQVVQKPGGEDDLAKTQVSFLIGVDSKEQTPITPNDTRGSPAESHPTSKGASISVQRQSREEANSREKGEGNTEPSWKWMETEIVEVLMFCGLTITGSLPLWVLPVKIALHGGVVFITLYILLTILVAFPILHLEIFVGQRHQTGIWRTFQSYGRAFEGFGAVIFFLTFISSVQGIQDSYLRFVHMKNVLFLSEEIISCRRYKERASCTSIYDDNQCKLKFGPHFRYHNDTCIAHENTTTKSSTVAEKYCRSLEASSPYDFDMQRLILYFALFCTFANISMGGLKTIRIVLAFAYVVFLTTFLLSVTYFPTLAKFRELTSVLWSVTTWKSLVSFETYSETLHLAFNSCGFALWGVMSAASLRSRNASSCKLALAMVANNLLVSFLSTTLAFNAVVAFKKKNPSALYHGLQKGEFMYAFGILTEVMMNEMDNPIWLFVNSIANLLAKLMRIFAALIIVRVAIRDYTPVRHQLSYTFAATVTLCATGYVLTWTRCYQSFRSYFAHLFTELYAAYYLLVVAGIVFVFIHVYDVREYAIDLSELYPEERSRPLPVRLMSSTCYWFYDSIILICLIVAVVELDNALKEREETSLLFIFADRVAILAPILIVAVYFLVNFNRAHRMKQYWTLFSITTEHPSFQRIHLLGDNAIKRETIEVPTFLLAAGIRAKEKITSVNSVPLFDSVMTTQQSSTNIFMRTLSRARVFKELVSKSLTKETWEKQAEQTEQQTSESFQQEAKDIAKLLMQPNNFASTQAPPFERSLRQHRCR
ncbi:hypothetical protein Aduo_010537 [Ancylostoma duodenale]